MLQYDGVLFNNIIKSTIEAFMFKKIIKKILQSVALLLITPPFLLIISVLACLEIIFDKESIDNEDNYHS